MSCVWVSPLECFEHTGVWEACLRADDPTAPQDLLPYAARQAFWDIGKEVLSKVAGEIGVQPKSGVKSVIYGLLYPVISKILPDADEADLCDILIARKTRSTPDELEDVVLNSEEIFVIAPEEVQKGIVDHQKRERGARAARAAYARDMQALGKRTAGERAKREAARFGREAVSKKPPPEIAARLPSRDPSAGKPKRVAAKRKATAKAGAKAAATPASPAPPAPAQPAPAPPAPRPPAPPAPDAHPPAPAAAPAAAAPQEKGANRVKAVIEQTRRCSQTLFPFTAQIISRRELSLKLASKPA